MNNRIMLLTSIVLFIFTLAALSLYGIFIVFPNLFPFSGMDAFELEDKTWVVLAVIVAFGGMSFLAKYLAKP